MRSELGPFTTGSEFIKAVASALNDSLESKGFLRLRKLNFVYPLGDNFDGWIGLSRDHKYASFGVIVLHANWGIHCRSIAKMTAEWRGERYKRGYICTAPLNWESETGSPQFAFRANTRLDDVADAVANFYAHEIVPVFEEHASYRAIIPCLESHADGWGGWDQALLLAYRLSGLVAKARAYEEGRANKCNADAAYSDYFSPFLARYRQEFEGESGI